MTLTLEEPVMHLQKPSKELLVDLINQDNDRAFLASQVEFDPPEAVDIHDRNTQIIMRGAEGSGYLGSALFHYDRLDMALAMPPTVPEGLEIIVPNDGFFDTDEIALRLNQMFNLQLSSEDLEYEVLNIDSLPYNYSLNADVNSLAWYGSIELVIVADRPMYADTFTTDLLDGFVLPNADISHLTDPSTSRNVEVTFRTMGGNLFYGDDDVPADGFIVSTNTELELGACARANGGFSVVVPSSDNVFALALNTEPSWGILISLGLINDVMSDNLGESYDISVKITCPDETVLILKTVWDTDRYKWINDDLSIEIDAGYSTEAVFQSRIDMADLISHLGTVSTSPGGAPLGIYVVRVEARRKNSMAPRVMTSFIVQASNGSGA